MILSSKTIYHTLHLLFTFHFREWRTHIRSRISRKIFFFYFLFSIIEEVPGLIVTLHVSLLTLQYIDAAQQDGTPGSDGGGGGGSAKR